MCLQVGSGGGGVEWPPIDQEDPGSTPSQYKNTHFSFVDSLPGRWDFYSNVLCTTSHVKIKVNAYSSL